MSLDGFVAGPSESEENPLGEGGEQLHEWVVRLEAWRRPHGSESALEQAREAAGDRDVALGGGANVAQQYLRAGLIDEMQLHVVPVLLGAGARLFDNLEDANIELECTSVVEAPGVTHLTYRILNHCRPPAVPPGPATVTHLTAPVSGSSAQYWPLFWLHCTVQASNGRAAVVQRIARVLRSSAMSPGTPLAPAMLALQTCRPVALSIA